MELLPSLSGSENLFAMMVAARIRFSAFLSALEIKLRTRPQLRHGPALAGRHACFGTRWTWSRMTHQRTAVLLTGQHTITNFPTRPVVFCQNLLSKAKGEDWEYHWLLWHRFVSSFCPQKQGASLTTWGHGGQAPGWHNSVHLWSQRARGLEQVWPHWNSDIRKEQSCV